MLVQIHLYIFSFHFYHSKTMRSYFCKFCLLHYQKKVFHIIYKIHLFDKRCNVSSIQNILDKLPKINKNNIILYNKYKSSWIMPIQILQFLFNLSNFFGHITARLTKKLTGLSIKYFKYFVRASTVEKSLTSIKELGGASKV